MLKMSSGELAVEGKVIAIFEIQSSVLRKHGDQQPKRQERAVVRAIEFSAVIFGLSDPCGNRYGRSRFTTGAYLSGRGVGTL
jgi:hypothetical protein